ncbi:PilZ domain-containing protein [Thalassotalea sp. PLHSN55]|uniref:PilZ domain-containing protein n=1 Tax=Thalassotalea sp. PLHSN55 TaxID=3435888 RepID=UPI003F833C6F
MTKDFSQHQEIISKFRGQVSKSDFEAKFATATKKIPKTERFLLKMELKRLAGECTRLVDLRGHVDGDCRAYEHDSRVHYLDDVAIKAFETNIKAYGSYTFGVYEAVMNTENNFRVIYQREKAGVKTPATADNPKVYEKTQYPAKLYEFGHYFDRSEERMNFAIAVLVADGNFKEVEAVSSDISINGCRLRLKGFSEVKIGQVLDIQFTGFAQEFEFGKQNTFSYEVRNFQNLEGIQLVGLQRVYTGNSQNDAFKRFLKGYIQGNKRRYKINLDNTIAALQSRHLETFTIAKLNELPVFIEQQGKLLAAKYALTCSNNQNVFQYWQNEKRHSTLSYLISPERIEKLLKARRLGRSFIVYSFVHESQGKSYFYSADEVELKEDKAFMSQFLGFAASKPNFAIFDLSLIDVQPSDAHSPLTLSDTLTKKNEYLNTPPSEEVKQLLAKIPYIVVVQDITHPQLLENYQAFAFEDININRIKRFGHKPVESLPRVDEVGINYKNQRQEPRFKYNTPVVATSDGVQWTGRSHDFSTSGLKIEIDKSTVLKKGDVVNLTFPNLQKITSSFELKDLPYEVMRINRKKTIVNLRVIVEQHQHIGRSFFRLLIDKNRDKLTPDEYALITPGMAKALRNIYSASLNIASFIVQTSGSRYKTECITGRGEHGKLLPTLQGLSDKRGHYNLYPFFGEQSLQNQIMTSLKKMQPSDFPENYIVYIAIDHSQEELEDKVSVRTDSQLKTLKLQQMFISTALKKGDFFAVQLKMSRADEPDMDHLNPELSYISSYAIHRGKQIEKDIWSVAGIIELYDITHEVLLRRQAQQH